MIDLSPIEAVSIVLAAAGAGAVNAVVGAGTLITFPTLLALGVPPITANVSNTIGLVPGSFAAVIAYRGTLRGRGPLVRRLLVASLAGGIAGATLLLVLPSDAFEFIVPPLLLASGALAAFQPRIAASVQRRRSRRDASRGQREEDASPSRLRLSPVLLCGVAATGVYGGYFGAAQGVILLAVLGVFVGGAMQEVNGVKNVLAGATNAVAATVFAVVAPSVDWTIVALVAGGAAAGGALGGRYGRRLRPRPLRAIVVTVAVVAALWQYAT